MWHHPKYYKELRRRNREVLRSGRGLAVNQAPHVSDQAISKEPATAGNQRSLGPGLKLRASSAKLREQQASGGKLQAPSCKDQASSHKRQAP